MQDLFPPRVAVRPLPNKATEADRAQLAVIDRGTIGDRNQVVPAIRLSGRQRSREPLDGEVE